MTEDAFEKDARQLSEEMQKARLEKLMKIMRLAERAGTEAEADNARAQLYRLQAEWEIDDALLAAHRGENDRVEQIITTKITISSGPTYFKAYLQLAHCVAKGCGADGFYTDRNKYTKEPGYYNVVGFEGDVERMKLLHTSLVLQCGVALSRHIGSHPYFAHMSDSEKYNVRRGFIYGFANGVLTKMQEARRVAKEERGEEAALVLVDRAALVKRKMDEMRLRSARGATRINAAAFGAGREAGKNADLGGSRIGGQGRKAIG